MRINRYLAQASGVSRRQADDLIANGRVLVNDRPAETGQQIKEGDSVTVDGQTLKLEEITTIMLHKPAGYVSSRARQGEAPTIYELLPKDLHHLKPVGRLDKDSRGLLLLTNDGELAQRLTHPKYEKEKQYLVTTDHPLSKELLEQLNAGIELKDGVSRLHVELHAKPKTYLVTMHEGKNRQIRRTFAALNSTVIDLYRIQFGAYELNDLKAGEWRKLERP